MTLAVILIPVGGSERKNMPAVRGGMGGASLVREMVSEGGEESGVPLLSSNTLSSELVVSLMIVLSVEVLLIAINMSAV